MKVLMVVYDGFTEHEYAIPFLALDHYKIPFDVAGLTGGEITGMIGLKIVPGRVLHDLNPGDYSALLLPGMEVTTREQIMGHSQLLELIRTFDQSQKIIGAVCGAPVLLAAAGILRGRRFCSDIATHPLFEGAAAEDKSALRDGHIVTGLGSRVYHFTAEFIAALAGPAQADAYRKWAGISD